MSAHAKALLEKKRALLEKTRALNAMTHGASAPPPSPAPEPAPAPAPAAPPAPPPAPAAPPAAQPAATPRVDLQGVKMGALMKEIERRPTTAPIPPQAPKAPPPRAPPKAPPAAPPSGGGAQARVDLQGIKMGALMREIEARPTTRPAAVGAPAAPPPPARSPGPPKRAGGAPPRIDQQAVRMGAVMKDIQKPPRALSPNRSAEREVDAAQIRPQIFAEALEGLSVCDAAAKAARRDAQLGPGLRVAKAMLSAMARGDSSSAALAMALESEPVDLAEQTERVEAAHRAIRATSNPEDAALLPRFGDSLAPAQVRADRALALLARLRDELSSPPLPVTPARTGHPSFAQLLHNKMLRCSRWAANRADEHDLASRFRRGPRGDAGSRAGGGPGGIRQREQARAPRRPRRAARATRASRGKLGPAGAQRIAVAGSLR